jgi:hypothetical protein
MKVPSRLRRRTAALATTGVLALATAACGSSDGTRALPTAGRASKSPQAEFLTLKGVSTSVDLDPATVKVLSDNKVTVTPVAPATVSQNGGTTTVSFPITQGYVAVYPTDQPSYIRGTFSHSGGLTFTAGGKSLQVTDFIVNPGTSMLSATVGGSGSVAQILDLDGTNVKVSQDAEGHTRLDGTVAESLATVPSRRVWPSSRPRAPRRWTRRSACRCSRPASPSAWSTWWPRGPRGRRVRPGRSSSV